MATVVGMFVGMILLTTVVGMFVVMILLTTVVVFGVVVLIVVGLLVDFVGVVVGIVILVVIVVGLLVVVFKVGLLVVARLLLAMTLVVPLTNTIFVEVLVMVTLKDSDWFSKRVRLGCHTILLETTFNSNRKNMPIQTRQKKNVRRIKGNDREMIVVMTAGVDKLTASLTTRN